MRTCTSSCCTANPVGACPWKWAINCWISWSWARRRWGAGPFFYARRALGPGSGHHQLDVLLDQLLEAPVVRNGRLEVGHLLRGNIAGNIPAILVALVVVVRPLRALADDADGAAVHALDLGDSLEDRFGGKGRVHDGRNTCHRHLLCQQEKSQYAGEKNFVLRTERTRAQPAGQARCVAS